MIKALLLATVILTLSACSGLRMTDNTFAAHAENLNILFLQIPSSDTQKRAMALVPEGATIISMEASANDLTSFAGVLNRILGVNSARIEGMLVKGE